MNKNDIQTFIDLLKKKFPGDCTDNEFYVAVYLTYESPHGTEIETNIFDLVCLETSLLMKEGGPESVAYLLVPYSEVKLITNDF